MLFWSIIFIASLALLVIAADYFTDYSAKLGLVLKISPFVIGVTIVAIGTSIPELVTSIFAAAKGEPSFVAGNVIGSNIANILLIIGISAIVARSLRVEKSLIELDLPLLSASTMILIVMIMDGTFSFPEAILSLVGFVIYSVYNYSMQMRHKLEVASEKIKEVIAGETFTWKIPAFIIGGGAGIYFGADWSIKAVIEISKILTLDSSIIAITAVAVGTSLPELAVSITAARKGQFEISIGNILGSNIFNGFVVMGIPALFQDLPITDTILKAGIPFLIGATILFVFSGIERKIYNFEGAMYILIYILFLDNLFHFL